MRIIIVGAGPNALTTAFYLAKAGLRPLVLEQREQVGGAAVTEELHPGFRCSTLAHSAGPLRAQIVRDMGLERRGVEFVRPDPRVTALHPDGRALMLHEDAAHSAREIAKFSPRDAERFPEFHAVLASMGELFADLAGLTPPSLDEPPPHSATHARRGPGPAARELWSLARIGRRFRALGRRNEFRLLRWGPMAVADLVAEWFETDLLRAVIAARGIFGTFLGPWSAGSGAVLLLQTANDAHSAGPAMFVRGGLGALTRAMADAAREAGAEIRTAAGVAEIRVANGRATGVVLNSGEAIDADVVVSGVDPKRTFLSLLDPVHLDPDFVHKMSNYRCPGTTAKVNLALSGLPQFRALPGGDNAALKGRIHIGPGIDYLERAFDAAKYGSYSEHPYLDVTIPTTWDASLAPAGQHVMSIYMQYAPFKLREGSWSDRREELGDAVVRTLEEYAPGLLNLIVAGQIVTPEDLQQRYGMTGGHIYHGEMVLDQLFTMRPLLGWSQYRTPIDRLYLCGAGTHPGGGVTGAPGANAAREIVAAVKQRKATA